MGKVVNSWGIEDSPCIAPDDVTLYYSSSGKSGYGSGDLFMTKRLDDTWLRWTDPINLGKEINTKEYDGGSQVDANGEYAYVNHSFFDNSQSDIATFLIPEAARPKPVVILKGKVVNKLTGEPVKARVTYENLKNNKEGGFTKSDKKDGSFTCILKHNADYQIVPVLDGWLCESATIVLTDSIHSKIHQIETTLHVVPLQIGEKIQLEGIFYDAGKYELLPSSKPELMRLVHLMKQHPKMEIEVAGHTDAGLQLSRDEDLNTLSLKRADEIRTFLISQGADEKRIHTKGYGRTQPISKINSQNRRIELKILKLH
jgi:outer membrane protein OmpA-like peptidoglycan-associated protein